MAGIALSFRGPGRLSCAEADPPRGKMQCHGSPISRRGSPSVAGAICWVPALPGRNEKSEFECKQAKRQLGEVGYSEGTGLAVTSAPALRGELAASSRTGAGGGGGLTDSRRGRSRGWMDGRTDLPPGDVGVAAAPGSPLIPGCSVLRN